MGGVNIYFVYGHLVYLAIAIPSLIIFVVGFKLLLFKNYDFGRKVFGFLLIIISIISIIYFRGPCYDNVKHSYTLDTKTLNTFEMNKVNHTSLDILIHLEGITEVNEVLDDYVRLIDTTNGRIEITVQVRDSIESANNGFVSSLRRETESYGLMIKKDFNPNYKYFSFYMTQMRADGGGWNQLMNNYITVVTIQKDNLLITLRENNSTGKNVKINNYIKHIVEAITIG